MKKFHAVAGLLFIALLAVMPLSAQAALREGVKVRITNGGPRITGVISSVTPDSLVLLTEGGGKLSVARSSVQTMQLSQGRSSSAGAKKGALWGGAIFGTLGVLSALVINDVENTYGGDYTNGWAVAALVTAEGAGIGAIIGGFAKSEKWENVSVTPSVGLGRAGISVAFRFR